MEREVVMRKRFTTIVVVCSVLFLAVTARASAAPLTNKDVIDLVKLALGDDVVIAKIRQASAVEFKLETADIENLKAAGVSGKVIAAMLERTTPPAPPQPPQNELEAAAARMGGVGPMGMVTRVELIDSSGTKVLSSQSGEMSHTNYVVGALLWFNVHDPHAPTRSSDKGSFIRVYSKTRLDEVGAFVRLDSNKEDRSLKVGNVSAFSFHGSLGLKVDKDWIVASDIKEEPAGVWELRPKKPLPPGEYGFYTTGMRMYSFGID
jgi:hypothetical protein